MSEFEQLEIELMQCNNCPFNESTDVRICGGVGKDYRVMFIAESPSTSGGTGIKRASDNFNITSADALFNEVRELFGFGDCYLTDFVKCGKAKGKPTAENVQNCLTYLKRELELVKPKAIVAVGKTFKVQTEGSKRKSYDFADFIREHLSPDIPVVSTFHYSYVWRWKKKKGIDWKGSRLYQIKAEWKQEYENQHRVIQELLAKPN
jgi:uracil-DNA glycosylase